MKVFEVTITGKTQEGELRHIEKALLRFVEKTMRTMGFWVDTASIRLEPVEVEFAAVLTVDFASDSAAELAAEHKLTNDAFVNRSPSGKTGFTVADVREVIREREVIRADHS